MIGKTISHYKILVVLGEGEMPSLSEEYCKLVPTLAGPSLSEKYNKLIPLKRSASGRRR